MRDAEPTGARGVGAAPWRSESPVSLESVMFTPHVPSTPYFIVRRRRDSLDRSNRLWVTSPQTLPLSGRSSTWPRTGDDEVGWCVGAEISSGELVSLVTSRPMSRAFDSRWDSGHTGVVAYPSSRPRPRPSSEELVHHPTTFPRCISGPKSNIGLETRFGLRRDGGRGDPPLGASEGGRTRTGRLGDVRFRGGEASMTGGV